MDKNPSPTLPTGYVVAVKPLHRSWVRFWYPTKAAARFAYAAFMEHANYPDGSAWLGGINPPVPATPGGHP